MICLSSKTHLRLKESLSTTQTQNDIYDWEKLINRHGNGGIDSFLAIMDHAIINTLFDCGDGGPSNLDEWFLVADRWCQKKVLKPNSEFNIEAEVLYSAWIKFSNNLKESLRIAKFKYGIPESGGLLAYVAGLSKCLVIDYQFAGEVAEFEIIAVINKPTSVFDFWGAIDQADMRARNHLKSILAMGHKLVWHRGTFVHVDRREDKNVFGPSIDTLILSEIMNQDLFENEIYEGAVISEIGCGNGLISASIAVNCPGLRELIAIDVEPASILCTQKNVSISCESRKVICGDFYFITGKFKPDLIRRRFALLVCNPPYIPFPEEIYRGDTGRLDFFRAVGGTELLHEVTRNVKRLLVPGGRLLLIVSNLSLKEAVHSIPEGFRYELPLGKKGFEVLFDVETVLRTPEWLEYLVDEKGLIFRDNLYYHSLHPMWISAPEKGRA